jgi:Sulfotransferase family
LPDRQDTGYFSLDVNSASAASNLRLPSRMMEHRDPDEPVIFLHLPKCGGTTLNRIIEWEYPPSRIFSVDPSFFRWSYYRMTRWPASRLARMRVFKGHMPFGLHERLPRPAVYITVLRDPIDRAVSEYYYARSRRIHPQHQMMKKLTIEEYIQTTPHTNVQTKLIAGEYSEYDFLAGECTERTLQKARNNLDRHFAIVGVTERFEETLALTKLILGWRVLRYANFNVTRARPAKQRISPEVQALIAQRYRFDMELYNYATSLLDSAVSQRRAAIDRELDAIRQARAVSPLESAYYRTASAIRKAICRVNSAL